MADAYTMPVNYGKEWYIPVEISYYPGEENTVMMRWANTWKYTSSFDVFWRFTLINGKYIDETSTVSVIPDNKNYQAKTTYDPEITTKVTGWIRPREAEDLKHWKYLCPWSPRKAGVSLSPLEWKAPAMPSVPTLEIDNYTLKMSTQLGKDVNNEYDYRTTRVDFWVTEDSGAYTIVKAPANRTTGLAQAQITLSAGKKVRVRAQARNEDAGGIGSSFTDYSGYVESPPIKTSLQSVKALTPTSVQISVAKVNGAKYYEVNYTSNPEDFKLESGGSSTTFEGISFNLEGLESGNTWYFRVRSVNDAGYSSWSDVKSVILGVRPSAPTTWSNVVTAKIGEDVVLNWTHNTRDGSSMRRSEVELNINGDVQIVTVEGKKDSDTQEWVDTGTYSVKTAPLPDNTKIRWRVRTKGVLDSYSDWSITREVKVYSPPSLSIVPYKTQTPTDNPLENLDSFPFYIIASASPSTQKANGFHISIVANEAYQHMGPNGEMVWVNANEEVYSKFFDFDSSLDLVEFGDYAAITSNTLTLKLMPSDVDFESGVNYTIKGVVSMDSGLSADAYNIISVSWEDQTMYPVADVYIDTDEYTAMIIPYCPIETSPEMMEELSDEGKSDRDLPLLENVVLSVYRIEYDGNMVLIMDNIENNRSTAVVDPHPPLNYARYRIVSTDQTTGAIGYVDIEPAKVGGTGIVIQWEEEWTELYTNPMNGALESIAPWSGSRLVLPANVDTSEGNKVDKTLVEYIGRKHPVSYYGTQIGTTATWNAVFPKADTDTLDTLRRLSAYTGDVYIREPKGVGYWASIDVSYNIQHLNLIIPVTLNVTRVEGGI